MVLCWLRKRGAAIPKSYKLSDRLAHLGVIIIVLGIIISFALGLLVALLGSFLIELGDGLGGGWGIPDLALTLAMFLGVPVLIISVMDIFRGRRRQTGRMVAFWGPLIISIGFIFIAHAVDPCIQGIWTLQSYWGSIPLCERFGSEINIHTRFHLLLHSGPAVVLVILYWVTLRKWYPAIAFIRNRSTR